MLRFGQLNGRPQYFCNTGYCCFEWCLLLGLRCGLSHSSLSPLNMSYGMHSGYKPPSSYVYRYVVVSKPVAEVCGMKVVLFTQHHRIEWLDTLWLSVLRASAQLHAHQFFSHFVKVKNFCPKSKLPSRTQRKSRGKFHTLFMTAESVLTHTRLSGLGG